MRMIRSLTALVLAAALFLSLPAGFCEGESPYSFVLENNQEYRTDLYPYVIHGESAWWYLSAADIEMMGLDAMCRSLDELTGDLEADFADAREALAPYLNEVPPVVICTDFSGHAQVSQTASAYYNSLSNFIKVFHNWTSVKASLKHEYVHYLTFACAKVPITSGFWAEGVAEYITRIAGQSRLSRSVNMGLSEEETSFYRKKGAWDDEADCLDERILYYALAQLCIRGDAMGMPYYAVCNEMIDRTEKIQQDPKPYQLSFYEAASMIAWLVEQYGEETVFACWNLDAEKTEEYFGEPFSMLYAGWAEWNTRKCDELGLVF